MKAPLSDAAKEMLNSPSALRSFMKQMLERESGLQENPPRKPGPITVTIPESGKTHTFDIVPPKF